MLLVWPSQKLDSLLKEWITPAKGGGSQKEDKKTVRELVRDW